MGEKLLKIVVYSDYICPFCYIGFHRMEKLKEQFELDIEWQPFEIHPETPKEGFFVNNLPFPKGYLDMVFANVKRLADEDGLTVQFSGTLPNSRLALFTAEFARKNGKFDDFHKLVFESYWKEGKDIGNLSLLLDLAESIGLNRNEIQAYIKNDDPLKELQKSLIELRKYGINGVPTFIIGDRMVVGAQSYEVFRNVIQTVLEENT
ncbi:MAG: DsbA family oxidoreductase [Promethearchaeota archaeon]|nr:MAG: DsbA family oxidoreductase [Candidatus Lokiarchaeota archaeon]